jgi:outer membrane protein assembly factor BamE (lipoprotein component of BamABCDE complex)
MKMNALLKLYLFLVIGIFVSMLASCSGTPKRHLAPESTIVAAGQSKDEVTQLLGHPGATRINPNGLEEWYYYEEHKSFWKKVPLARSYLGREEVESIQIIFDQDKVAKVKYYVPVRK